MVAGAAVNDTAVVSVATDGTPADGPSGPGSAVSPNGRYVAFESTADNLSDADNDAVVNIYLHDRETGETSLVSRATGAAGAGADADSRNPAISPGGGRYVAFESGAANLSDVDNDPTVDVFLRDLETGTTTLISRAPDGSPADGASGDPSLSKEAGVVAFESSATNLSALDNDAVQDVFTYDRAAGATTLVSRPRRVTRSCGGPLLRPLDLAQWAAGRLRIGRGQPRQRRSRRVHQRLHGGAATEVVHPRVAYGDVGLRGPPRERRLDAAGDLRSTARMSHSSPPPRTWPAVWAFSRSSSARFPRTAPSS